MQAKDFMLPFQGASGFDVGQKALPFVEIDCPFRALTKN